MLQMLSAPVELVAMIMSAWFQMAVNVQQMKTVQMEDVLMGFALLQEVDLARKILSVPVEIVTNLREPVSNMMVRFVLPIQSAPVDSAEI